MLDIAETHVMTQCLERFPAARMRRVEEVGNPQLLACTGALEELVS